MFGTGAVSGAGAGAGAGAGLGVAIPHRWWSLNFVVGFPESSSASVVPVCSSSSCPSGNVIKAFFSSSPKIGIKLS